MFGVTLGVHLVPEIKLGASICKVGIPALSPHYLVTLKIYFLFVFFVLFWSTSSDAQELPLGIYSGVLRGPYGTQSSSPPELLGWPVLQHAKHALSLPSYLLCHF